MIPVWKCTYMLQCVMCSSVLYCLNNWIGLWADYTHGYNSWITFLYVLYFDHFSWKQNLFLGLEAFHQSICTTAGLVLHSAGTSYCIVIALDWERAVRITKQHNALSLPLYITVGCVDWCVGGYININSEGGKNCHNVTFIIMWNRRVCDQEKGTVNQKQVPVVLSL